MCMWKKQKDAPCSFMKYSSNGPVPPRRDLASLYFWQKTYNWMPLTRTTLGDSRTSQRRERRSRVGTEREWERQSEMVNCEGIESLRAAVVFNTHQMQSIQDTS